MTRYIDVKLDPQDDAGDPRMATQVAKKLVDDKVADRYLVFATLACAFGPFVKM